jgi:hypothetical protein
VASCVVLGLAIGTGLLTASDIARLGARHGSAWATVALAFVAGWVAGGLLPLPSEMWEARRASSRRQPRYLLWFVLANVCALLFGTVENAVSDPLVRTQIRDAALWGACGVLLAFALRDGWR